MRSRVLLASFLIVATPFTESGAEPPAPQAATTGALSPAEVLVASPEGLRRATAEDTARDGLVVVDLSDEWAPFLFSDADVPGAPAKPNHYRATFVALANDRATPDELFLESPAGRAAVLSTVPADSRSTDPKTLSPDEKKALAKARASLLAERKPNFLEVYGIPPTLTVLSRRVREDAAKTCMADIDAAALRSLDTEIRYQNRDLARKEHAEAVAEVESVGDEAALRALESDPASAERLQRYRRAQVRLRAIAAAQSRLVCEGLLTAGRFEPGVFDHATHTALAEFERKNDIFGWGFLGGETQAALVRPPLELHFETFRRILAERVADAAGILEDGSVSKAARPATYRDAAGVEHPVPNLVGDFVDRLLQAIEVTTPEAITGFLESVSTDGFATLRVAFAPPPLPPYYGPVMDLSAAIDRGDVWYDFPFDADGNPVVQPRHRYPSFTLFVTWRKQKIPLVRWRTTIGSWRSELHPDGRVHLKYKNSDVGPRMWKNIVAGPVWVPPEATPGKDLLTKKTFDRRQGPVNVVNTEVMGPGFASAFGLVMAIHLEKLAEGSLFDNKIRTHGSVDYTSIARRFSHGCHRLVNNRAVRLFDFILKHRSFRRLGSRTLSGFKRKFEHEGRRYEYTLPTRGYYYDLSPPVPVVVLEGRIRGEVKEPIAEYRRKPGVAYAELPADSPVEMVPVVGP